jgi:digeranylgeranylglycerophospholipid reductase
MNADNEFDVVIAGAGFTGLYLAQLLSKKYKVCIVEKNSTISGPLNTTGSTMIETSDDIFSLFSIPKNLLINSYNSIEISSQKSKVISPAGGFEWGLLDVFALRNYLYNSFQDSAEVLLEHEALNLIKEGSGYKGVEVYDKQQKIKKTISAKIIVDATGSKISLASKAGIKTPKHLANCFQVDADVSNQVVDSSKINMYLGFDFCSAGYAYVFPISENRVRIGACGTSDFSKLKFNAEESFQKFLKYIGYDLQNIDNEVNVSVFTGGVVKNNSHLNFISLGDAAGYISPVIGEGIRFAFHSAGIASDLIEECLKTNNFAPLRRFNSLWNKRFGFKFYLGYLMQWVFAHLTNSLMNVFISRVKSITQKDPRYIYRIFSTKFNIYDIIKLII